MLIFFADSNPVPANKPAKLVTLLISQVLILDPNLSLPIALRKYSDNSSVAPVPSALKSSSFIRVVTILVTSVPSFPNISFNIALSTAV